ncbi:Ran GTPase-activating protein [Handroanthus impetiginosus]|uniref:Ran GTPase-activating protein n=1 Tax=Handroanthus impetiginosus TaxID=429701 RepID=A0A2G9GBE7_9LAMI|nr:Ran GTPase-activating protein [Handroanthus impetiginosus]
MRFQMFSTTFFILIFFSNSNLGISQCLQDQKELLLQFRNNLAYDSSLSTKLVQWNESLDCCQWNGVKCDVKGHVSSLDLSSESISGGISDSSSSLFKLVFLQNLNLAQNSFDSVEFPSGFGQLMELRYLNLSNSGFLGQIPLDLSRLTRLVDHDLSSTFSLSLMIENPDLGRLIQNFTRLRELYLDGVNISAKGDEWCNAISSSLPDLRVFSLSNAYLKGPFDSSLVKLQSLSVIRLDGNTISSPFPEFFADFSNLQFIGPVPSFAFLKKLTTINLHANRLTGQIPDSLWEGLENLDFLDLSENSLEDVNEEVPISSLFPRLGSLMLASCKLQKLPLLKNQSSLMMLDLAENQLEGEFPTGYGKLKSLRILNLRRNNLSGDIPDTFPVGCALETLDLSWNFLKGKVPKSLAKCTETEIINLSNNELNDSFPCWLRNLCKLRVLVLSFNKFHGNISCLHENTNNWPNLQIINIASNNFNGILPANLFRNLKALMVVKMLDHLHLYLAETNIYYQDSITVTVKGLDIDLQKILTIFTSIDFSNNHFQGIIPDTLGDMKSLYILNFSRNALSGHIPSSIGNLRKLESLDLSFNNLSGRSRLRLEESHRAAKCRRSQRVLTLEMMGFVGFD